MRVLLDRRGVRAILRIRPVACQAHAAAGLPQHRVVLGAVRIMATEAGDAARIHQAGHEVVALHAVLVRGAVGEMGERRFAELVILELPEVARGSCRREIRPASHNICPRSDS